MLKMKSNLKIYVVYILILYQSIADSTQNVICYSSDYEFTNETNISSDENVSKYSPTWSSLDSRPIPSWYDNAKVGVKVSWGVSSVPGYRNEWFWHSWKGSDPDPKSVKFMADNYPPKFTYQDFASQFSAEFFDPNKWAEILKSSGAKYVVFTSKHHDGYALYPSAHSFGWNSMDTGPNRDLIGEFSMAIRNKTDIKFGLYHSLYEWFHPLYLRDKENNFNTRLFVTRKVIPEFKELIQLYKPEVIWSDGDWEAPDDYWGSKDVLAWLYNTSPVKNTVVVNDRWGNGTTCRHGGVWNCADRYNPGHILPHKWENAFTIDKYSWSYRRDANLEDFLSPAEIIEQLVTTVSCGGNFLIDIGPTKDGMIPPIFQERLLQLGQWLMVNGEAIYGSSIWPIAQNDSVTDGVWYTWKPNEKRLFAIILEKAWPRDDKRASRMTFGAVDVEKVTITKITLLGKGEKSIKWKSVQNGISVNLPYSKSGEWAWCLVIHILM